MSIEDKVTALCPFQHAVYHSPNYRIELMWQIEKEIDHGDGVTELQDECYWLRCKECHCVGPAGDTPEEALKYWNSQLNIARLADEIDNLGCELLAQTVETEEGASETALDIVQLAARLRYIYVDSFVGKKMKVLFHDEDPERHKAIEKVFNEDDKLAKSIGKKYDLKHTYTLDEFQETAREHWDAVFIPGDMDAAYILMTCKDARERHGNSYTIHEDGLKAHNVREKLIDEGFNVMSRPFRPKLIKSIVDRCAKICPECLQQSWHKMDCSRRTAS